MARRDRKEIVVPQGRRVRKAKSAPLAPKDYQELMEPLVLQEQTARKDR